MKKEYLGRITELLKKAEMDAILIAPSEEMEFLIGFSPVICERFQSLIVKADGTYFYICNLLTVDEMQEVLGEDIKVYGWFDGDGYMDTVKQAFEDYGLMGKKIGVNSSERACIILDIMKGLDVEFVNGKPLLEDVRIIKNEADIENLRIAGKITEEVFLEVIKFIKPGVSEGDIENFINDAFLKRGAGLGFTLICAGPNGAYPHYGGNQGVVKEKDVVLLDFGCTWNGMCSDMTRTVFVGGITEEEREMYNYVLDAVLAAESKVKEGAYIPEVDKAARDIIDSSGYGKTFVTRLGHGLGYSVHEAPDIKQSNKRNLEKGMVFSIEPGIYRIGEYGIRIEDILVVTEDGFENFNTATKEIIVIE
ncbi:MAG: Xaa-Pro peptidase family protein [Eubacteriales bacterium]